MNRTAWEGWTGLWATLGLREMVVVGLVALLFYGRAGLRHSHHARTVWSWMIPRRRARPARPAARAEPKSLWAVSKWGREERIFWALVVVAAAGTAAWIVTRTLILGTPPSAR